MSSESIVFGSDSNYLKELESKPAGNAYFFQALKFSVAATIILPIVGQIISTGQLFRNLNELKKATFLGYLFFALSLLVNAGYIAGVLYIFGTSPEQMPEY